MKSGDDRNDQVFPYAITVLSSSRGSYSASSMGAEGVT